ncbi:MAG: response regulator transcription factor [Dehalococcoidia bacterium]|nr:response regulator transcription factor [Dehalococcoidia bacterium]
MLILVGDDEQEYGEIIEELLRSQSHRVVLAASPESFRRFLQRSEVDLVVMSSAFAGESLPAAIWDIRRTQSAHIVVTFEERSPVEVADCLAAGADDCVRKPFHPSEFAARMEAIARRSPHPVEEAEPPAVEESATWTRSGSLRFDETTLRVRWAGADLACSKTEYEILRALAETHGRVLTHAYLNRRVWGYSSLSDATLLKGHISSIRAKLRSAGITQPLIRTVNGVGYGLAHVAEDLVPSR